MAPKRLRDSEPVNKKTPKKKSRPKLTKRINLNDIQVPLTNRFAELSDDESEMVVGDESSKQKKVSPIVVTDNFHRESSRTGEHSSHRKYSHRTIDKQYADSNYRRLFAQILSTFRK